MSRSCQVQVQVNLRDSDIENELHISPLIKPLIVKVLAAESTP